MKSEKIKKISQYLLEDGYSLKLTVSGNSMFPFLLENERVKIVPFQQSNINKGDILVFKKSGRFIAHRLIHIDKKQNRLLTKGDFCFQKDSPLSTNEIIGKITVVYRKGKEIRLNTQQRNMINLIIAKFSFILPYLARVLKKLKIVKIPSEYFRN